MSDRFHCPDPPDEGRIVLRDEEARHLALVLRAVPGDRVEVFDGKGRSYEAEVRELGKNRAVLAVVSGPIEEPPPSRRLTLATAVPKGERFDWLVEKATEIGVETLIPLTTERSVVDPGASKLERLRRKVIEASKQCGRNRLMEILPTRSLDDLLSARSWQVRLIAHPGGSAPMAWPKGGSLALAIGPEGGFSEREIEAAGNSGWSLAGLGVNRLRVETAGLIGGALVLALASGETS